MIVEYTLISCFTSRKPHVGLASTAYYKKDVEDGHETPLRMTVFNRWPKVKIKLDTNLINRNKYITKPVN